MSGNQFADAAHKGSRRRPADLQPAMAHSNKVGLGRVTISSRERPVLVEPRGAGLVMSTLRSADEVRPAEFSAKAKGEADPDVVAIAENDY